MRLQNLQKRSTNSFNNIAIKEAKLLNGSLSSTPGIPRLVFSSCCIFYSNGLMEVAIENYFLILNGPIQKFLDTLEAIVLLLKDGAALMLALKEYNVSHTTDVVTQKCIHWLSKLAKSYTSQSQLGLSGCFEQQVLTYTAFLGGKTEQVVVKDNWIEFWERKSFSLALNQTISCSCWTLGTTITRLRDALSI